MKLIINADDFGMAKSINNAVFELSALGSISSTSVMVNMPYAAEVTTLKNIGVGLHVNLTQGKAILDKSEINSLVDENGDFYCKAILWQKIKKKEVVFNQLYMELRAQYLLLREMYQGQITHFDSHQGSNKLDIVRVALSKIAEEFNVKLGFRFYNKLYISPNNGLFVIEEPTIGNIYKFGFKRVLKEYYIRVKSSSLRKHFFVNDGLLLARNHDLLDTLELISKLDCKNFSPKKNLLVEIGCHPATSIDDLFETSLLDQRVSEYQFLKSKEFVNRSSCLKLSHYPVSYKN